MGIRYTFISEDLPINWPPEIARCFADAGIGTCGDILYSLEERKWWGHAYEMLAEGLACHTKDSPWDTPGESLFYIVELSETGQVARIDFILDDSGEVFYERQPLSVPAVRY